MKSKRKPNVIVYRMFLIIVSIMLMGFGVALLRFSCLGTDPFSCMDLGISAIVRNKLQLEWMSFGVWQIIMNGILIMVVLIYKRNTIGFGTIINMLFVGVGADFWIKIFEKLGQGIVPIPFLLRIASMLIGTIIICLGVAVYMECEMGIAPYDALAPIIQERTKGRLSFRVARIITDCICTAIGFACGLVLGIQWELIGIGTIIMAFGTGPIVDFFRKHVAKRILPSYSIGEIEE